MVSSYPYIFGKVTTYLIYQSSRLVIESVLLAVTVKSPSMKP